MALALLLALPLGACAALSTPDNSSAKLFGPEKAARLGARSELSYSSKLCPPPGTADFMMPAAKAVDRKGGLKRLTMRYSPGDRLHVLVFGSPEFSGDYVVNADGMIVLPYAGQVEAIGLSNGELTARIEASYVRAGIFMKQALKITTRPIQYAPINVTVAGAVFFPGRHAIGGVRDSDKLDKALTKFGDNPMDRFVPAALRAAGGVRPDAELSSVKVTRAGRTFSLDWRGAITGQPVDDMPLIEGDHVEIAEAGCFQSALVRPSQITPPGVRIFVSNLSAPAYTNAQSAGGNPQLAGSMPYGSRLLQGLVTANCVGGTLPTNAARYAVLISRNPKTRETEVVQRSIEELVRSADRDKINPYLMPDDAIACYDSTVTEIRDVLATVLNPALSIQALRK